MGLLRISATTENYRPSLSSERLPHMNKIVNCPKIIKERRKIGPRWVHDTKADWTMSSS
jgi:hypothetical protein